MFPPLYSLKPAELLFCASIVFLCCYVQLAQKFTAVHGFSCKCVDPEIFCRSQNFVLVPAVIVIGTSATKNGDSPCFT